MKINFPLHFPICLAILFLMEPVNAQLSPDLAALEKVISGSATSGGISGPESEEYKSLTQFEYENIVRNIDKVDESNELEQYRKELQDRKLELAIKLCQEDRKACYLIDEYRNSVPSETDVPEKDLTLYGIDLFAAYPLSFEQSDMGGPPRDYQIRSGDVLTFNTYGARNATYDLRVSREGTLDLPGIGRTNVIGLRIDEARELVNNLVKDKIIGLSASLSIKSITPIQIYALGMLSNPGSYKISSVSKAVNAIIASGGFTNASSLRNVEIKRDNNLIAKIDLYDLLLFGDSSKDVLLENNDVVFVPSIKRSVKVFGAVNNPHIFEIKDGDTLNDILMFAQGTKVNAAIDKISIRRKNNLGQYEFIKFNKSENVSIRSDDVIYVPYQQTENLGLVSIFGAVKSPGSYPLTKNSKLSDFLNPVNDFLEDTYPGFSLILRKDKKTRSFNIVEFDSISSEFNNIDVFDGDKIYIFNYDDVSSINSIMLKNYISSASNNEFLGKQQLDVSNNVYGSFSFPTDLGNKKSSLTDCFFDLKSFGNEDFIKNSILKYSVFGHLQEIGCTPLLNSHPELLPILVNRSIPVFGSIRSPGLYPVSRMVNAKDLISIAGGQINSKNNDTAYDIGSYDNLSGDKMLFKNLKYISVRDKSQTSINRFVKIYGEVKYPGTYQIDSSTTLLDLYRLAGGLLPNAYAQAGIITRESIKSREAQALQKAEAELADILASAVATGVITQSATDLMALVNLMNQVASAQPIGRLITEMNESVLTNNPEQNIFLQSGDTVYIPERNNVITIYGSVLNPTTVPFNAQLNLKDYINLAGGYKDYADEDKAYVLLPNGKAIKPSTFIFARNGQILPGSTVIVPRKARPLDGLSLVEAVSPVLANLSISLASINSIIEN